MNTQDFVNTISTVFGPKIPISQPEKIPSPVPGSSGNAFISELILSDKVKLHIFYEIDYNRWYTMLPDFDRPEFSLCGHHKFLTEAKKAFEEVLERTVKNFKDRAKELEDVVALSKYAVAREMGGLN